MITIILAIGILLIISLFIFIKTKKDNTEFPTLDPIVENKKFIYNDSYVEQCPPDKLYNDGQLCVSECPSIRPFLIGTSCTSSCTEKNKYLENDKICLPSCFPKYINNNTNKCVESCNKYSDDFLRVCYESVPDGKFSYEKKIVSKCPSYYNSKKECSFPKEVEFLNGIISGDKGEYISVIGKKDNKYYAYIFNNFEWYDIELSNAVDVPVIVSSGDGQVQLIKIPINNNGIKKCIISKDYGKTFQDFNVSYFLNTSITGGQVTSFNEFQDLDITSDGNNITAISYPNIILLGAINSTLVVVDTFTNNVKYYKPISSVLSKLSISNYSNNIILLYNNNSSINNQIYYQLLDSELKETFNFNANIFPTPEMVFDNGPGDAVDDCDDEDYCIRWRNERWEVRFDRTVTPRLYNNSNYEFDMGTRNLNLVSQSIQNVNNINNYSIVKNNDYLFIVTNDKTLYVYNIINQNQYSKNFEKSLSNFSNPKLFVGKNNDNIYLLDVGYNNKIYKVTLENEIAIRSISTSPNISYNHLSSNLINEKYVLAMDKNNVYISNDYGEKWTQMK